MANINIAIFIYMCVLDYSKYTIYDQNTKYKIILLHITHDKRYKNE